MGAGDWIKMRGNLWDDPRVARLCDITDSGEAAIVGALYWLWAAADQHTENGYLPGLTLRQIDRKTGVAGFGAALCAIEWLREDEDGVTIIHFEEHNGESAKKRASDAKRKAQSRQPEGEAVRDLSATSRTNAGQKADKKRRIVELEVEVEVEVETEEEREEPKETKGEGADDQSAGGRKVPADLTDAAFAYNARAKSLRLPVIREARISSLTDKYRAACRKVRENIPEFTLVECVNRLLDQRERGSPFFREARFLDFEWLLKREHNGTQMNAEKVWYGKYSNADVGSGRDQRNGTTGEPVKPRRTAADFGAREWSDVRAELDKQKLPPLPS